MSTIKTTNITHGSNSGTANLVLNDTGNVEARKVNGCQRIVLEQFFTPCDGSTIATSAGNLTVPNVTAYQDTGESWADLTGSPITYTPPTGATQVIYSFDFHVLAFDTTGFAHFKLLIGGTEVTDSRRNWYDPNGGGGGRSLYYSWGFNIGGTANAATGRQATWTSGKEIKWQIRDYSSGHDTMPHRINYWEGADATDFYVKPCVGITAIG